MKCRFDGSELSHVFVDLATAPLSNSFVSEGGLVSAEMYVPLKLYVNPSNWLVQVNDYSAEAIFGDDYVYYSSYSKSWLQHAESYVGMAIERLGLGRDSMVAEIAANDGYLLRYFHDGGVPCYGVEPSTGPARVARDLGIDMVEEFFGASLARELASTRPADLIVANNVLAHVPDVGDFLDGLRILLKPDGVITMEFPHLMELVQYNQFDTIYHEHLFYYSLTAVQHMAQARGLSLFDVERLSTHGGSLRVWLQRSAGCYAVSERVPDLLRTEQDRGMESLDYYLGFQERVDEAKSETLTFLMEARRHGKSIVAYGAAAKGNTFLNYCGIRRDLVDYVVDASPHKIGRYLPGSRLPVVAETHIRETQPDYVLILPWNLQEEIANQLEYIRDWGGAFVVAIPSLRLF
jgi:hypothetical protein